MQNKIQGWLDFIPELKSQSKLKPSKAKSILRCIQFCANNESIEDRYKLLARQMLSTLNADGQDWSQNDYYQIGELFAGALQGIKKAPHKDLNKGNLVASKAFLKFQKDYDVLLVTDLEMTCLQDRKEPFQMETIEIGCAVVDTKTLEVISTFQSFVKPKVNPTLSSFCMKLTNIKQSDVDSALGYAEASSEFKKFISNFNSPLFVAWGSGDHKQLNQDAELNEVASPIHGIPLMNLKQFFLNLGLSKKGFGLKKALNILDIEQTSAHRALDDALHTAKLLPKMIKRAEENLASQGAMKYLTKKTLESKGRLLTFILRHKPELAEISLDDQGWCSVENLVKGLHKDDKNTINERELFEIVKFDDCQRFQLSSDFKEIRCVQGHSLPGVNIDFTKIEDAPTLYHGTSTTNFEKIKSAGEISPMGRNMVHLTASKDTALEKGKRYGEPVALKVDTKSLIRDGYVIYKAHNDVYLTNSIPQMYFSAEKH